MSPRSAQAGWILSDSSRRRPKAACSWRDTREYGSVTWARSPAGQLAGFADVGHVPPVGNAVDVVALGDDVGLADLLRPPAQFGHAVLDRARAQPLGGPALHQLLDVLGLQALDAHVHEAHFPQLVGDQRQDAFPVGLGGKAAVPIAGTELLQFVVQVLHRPLGRGGSLRCCRCLFGLVSVSVRLTAPGRGEIYKGRRDTTPVCAVVFAAGHRGTRCLASMSLPVGNRSHRFEPLTQGSWGRRGGAS